MELEIKDLPAKDKQKYRTRLASYKAENKKLLADMVYSCKHWKKHVLK